MKATTLALAAAVLGSSVMAFQGAGRGAAQAPAGGTGRAAVPAQPSLSAFEEGLLSGKSVSDLLAPERDNLIKAMRTLPSAAKSWQLEPALVTELKDDELFRFVAFRADAYVACSIVLYGKYPIEEVTDQNINELNLQKMFWTAPPAGPLRMSQDCTQIVAPDDKEVRLRTRGEFDTFLSVQKSFNTSFRTSSTVFGVVKNRVFIENLAYLKREYGRAPHEEAAVENALARDGAKVYSGLTFTLQTYVLLRGTSSTPFLVVPLSH